MEWSPVLNDDPVDWLLEGDPSLRFRVLTELLDQPPDGSEAAKARNDLMTIGPAAKVLAMQRPGGHWGREEDFYVRTKYRGTVWNLILLAQLGADPADRRVGQAGDFVLRWSRRADGGFTYSGGPHGGDALSLPCLTGNMAWSLAKLGMGEDPRMMATYRHLSILARDVRSGDIYEKCRPCRSGMVKVLMALLDAPPGASAVLDRGSTARLAGAVAERCLPGGGEEGPRPEWYEYGFPLMWNTDLVEIVELLARAGMWSDQMAEARDAILSKQDTMGRWGLERCFQGRHLVSFGRRGSPSRWTTFRVLRMLKHLPDESKA